MARGYPDFEGNKSGLYLKPEWAAKEGTDKTFIAGGVMASFSNYVVFNYTVPVGKVLYLNAASFSLYATAVANADHNQIGAAVIYNATVPAIPVDLAYLGGNGGGAIVFPKPVILKAGEVLVGQLVSKADHSCTGWLSVSGYEV